MIVRKYLRYFIFFVKLVGRLKLPESAPFSSQIAVVLWMLLRKRIYLFRDFELIF